MSKVLRNVTIAWLLCVVPIIALVIVGSGRRSTSPRLSKAPAARQVRLLTHEQRVREQNPRSFSGDGVTMWWDAVPDHVKKNAVDTGTKSNILLEDYGTAESCKSCHAGNYESWSSHPHRFMNTRARAETVKGDFSGEATIEYLGGVANFYQEGDEYRMRLEKGTTQREYRITQTIGSRFFQYYVGRQLEGPEPTGHKFYRDDHVLQFGYWLEAKEWVPVVHVGRESPDGERHDPFLAPPSEYPEYSKYSKNCSGCHTTIPFGDWLLSNPKISRFTPTPLDLSLSGLLAESHSELWDGTQTASHLSDDEFQAIADQIPEITSPENTVNLGISCEACHFGSKAHVENKEILPTFLPTSPHIFVKNKSGVGLGRNHDNVNWACGRCHAGNRPQFANGISTWNSTEYSDATQGSCYSELTCIDCHNPHRAIGPKWTRTAAEDDASCVKCHDTFQDESAIVSHTHHPAGSEGSRCMNCHMPRINEGLQDAVRTHTIFSPTDKEMLRANHPNACNLCHTDQTIDWTTTHLSQWYGESYTPEELPSEGREEPAGLRWLKSENEAVRLVTIAAMTRNNDRWALSELLSALDDSYLLNRQFARRGLEQMLDITLADFGYRFYMTPEERRQPIADIRSMVIPPSE